MDQVEDVTSLKGGFARICVFCGSSSGKKAIYTEVAEELGSELVKRSIDLVYGGGSIGLMGTVAQAVNDAGGHVVGVIPRALMPKEICGATVGELVAVDDMHQRKAEMARRADAFVALPGGFGTFEEVLEIITWAQLGIHKKPVGLLNVDGYYDAMLTLFDKALDQGFLNMASHNIVISAPTAAALLDKLQSYVPTVDKSVPELTWETTSGVSAAASIISRPPTSGKTTTGMSIKAAAAVYDCSFHMNQSSTRGARAFQFQLTPHVMRISWFRLATGNGVSCMNVGAARSCRHVIPVHARPSPVYGQYSRYNSRSTFTTVGMKVMNGAPIGAAGVVLL